MTKEEEEILSNVSSPRNVLKTDEPLDISALANDDEYYDDSCSTQLTEHFDVPSISGFKDSSSSSEDDEDAEDAVDKTSLREIELKYMEEFSIKVSPDPEDENLDDSFSLKAPE